jgi:hypothetical protein
VDNEFEKDVEGSCSGQIYGTNIQFSEGGFGKP